MITLGIGKINPKRCEPSPAVLRALCETVAWCLSSSVQSDQLRSRELDPSDFLRVPPFEELGIDVWVEKKRESYERATQAICELRSSLIRDARIEMTNLAMAQTKGRLLLYEPLETVEDGAASAGSRGFFDIEDAPPWDTWVVYSEDSIFCWVPGSLAQSAQAGIDANPVDCIHWCDWSRLSEPREV
jgi:hypothetical protein